MGFYLLSKDKRTEWVNQIKKDIQSGIQNDDLTKTIEYFSHHDTYVRKSAYLSVGRIYTEENSLKEKLLALLNEFLSDPLAHIRQTAINAAGEIGIRDFEIVAHIFDRGLFDENASVRNAVIGSVKKMGIKNPVPVLSWAKKYLHHPEKEIRREICHGIELRGRTHPQDILPLLEELQHDKTARVRNTLIHVLGQISYKKGCLATVIEALNNWENKALTEKAMEEIIDVHHRYRSFAMLTQEEAADYIQNHYKINPTK